VNTAADWIRLRLAGAPRALVERMVAALPTAQGRPTPDVLAEGAITLYAQVLAGDGTREDALPLLAADALFTHAFQAQAELDYDGLTLFAHRWGGGGRLARMAEP
jgi:hypothetical protein